MLLRSALRLPNLFALACAPLLALLSLAGPAVAQDGPDWAEGTNYFALPKPQPTTTPGHVEVLEVFSYACPACNEFQPVLKQLRASLPPEAQMAYLPASFNPQEDWPVFQRAYFAAQALGVAQRSHDAMYDAVWGPKPILDLYDKGAHHWVNPKLQPTIEDLAKKFYAGYGVTPEQFLAAANSFKVDSQMRHADAQVQASEVDSTPTIIVNGKYRLTPASAGGYPETVELVRYLVAREAARR